MQLQPPMSKFELGPFVFQTSSAYLLSQLFILSPSTNIGAEMKYKGRFWELSPGPLAPKRESYH